MGARAVRPPRHRVTSSVMRGKTTNDVATLVGFNPSRGDTTKCSAKSSRTGKACQKSPVVDSNVCRFHGGAAPQVKAKARQRIEAAADRMARELLRMAVDQNVSDTVKLAVIRDALDRAGLKPQTEIAVSQTPAYEEVIWDAITHLEFRSLTPVTPVISGAVVALFGVSP